MTLENCFLVWESLHTQELELEAFFSHYWIVTCDLVTPLTSLTWSSLSVSEPLHPFFPPYLEICILWTLPSPVRVWKGYSEYTTDLWMQEVMYLYLTISRQILILVEAIFVQNNCIYQREILLFRGWTPCLRIES